MATKSTYSRRKRGRKPPQMRKRILFITELSVCFVILGLFAYRFYLYTQESDQFRINHIEIKGLRVLDDTDILQQSGLLDIDNVLYLDADAVCEAVTELPYVRSCSMRQVFPDTVILEIVERVGILTLQLNSRSFLLDEDGIVLLEYRAEEVPLAPFVTNVGELEFIEIGQELTQPALKAAFAVWDHFSTLPMAEDVTVSELAAYSDSEIVMYCDELMYEIRWGIDGVDKQAQRFNVLWDNENGSLTCAEYLDLRFGDNLVCK